MPRQLRICNIRGQNQGQEVGHTIEFPLNVYIVTKTVTSVCVFIRYCIPSDVECSIYALSI